jgi:TRAP-type C4-dicarboxylate transport system permease small subunit
MRQYLLFRQLEIWVTLVVMAIVLCLIGWATLTRYIGTPNVWVIEVTQAFFAWLCLLSASIAFRNGSHFSIDILSKLLPDTLGPWISVFRFTVLLVLLVLLIWISFDYVELTNRRKLPLSGIRFSWVAAAFPVACSLMALTCIEHIIRDWPRKNTAQKETTS